KMTIEKTGCAACHDDNASIGIAGESLQRLGERAAHFLVEIDASFAAECNDSKIIRYSCRQNISVHSVLLSCGSVFFKCQLPVDIFDKK
ncbi:MAG TPA: hypothetical protein VK137_17715, partial [Planctomycetaceae bacterium]|nr:hypothetical protein [Planctomycetaceae bacterium]